MMAVAIHTKFTDPDLVHAVEIEPQTSALFIFFANHDVRGMTLAEFDRIAAEVATFRRLNAEAAEQERNAA